MIKTYNKDFIILLFLFVAASLFRYVYNQSEYINNIIALINIASLIYVRFLIIDITKTGFNSLLSDAKHLGDKIKEKKIQHFRKKTNRYSIFMITLGILYVTWLANPIVNDILGFAAFFMSIQSNYIAELNSKRIFKKK